MTKLISGRVGKVPSANVRADRYQFLELSEAEPDLGLPSQLGQVFTSDLSGNRYWTRLDTANVTENGNLYFTNQRVTANVANLSIGILFDVDLGANLATGKALVYDSNVGAFVPVFVNSEIANVADIAVRVLSLENQTTANVREASSNLYFTNTRVLDAISLATINPNNVNAKVIVTNSITSNIWNNLYTSNVVEKDNLFYTNSRVISAVVPLLTTANVIESASNLYFTTARARESVSNSTGVYYNTSSGVFSIGQDVALTSDVQFRDLTLSGNLFILGNVALIAANTLTINDPLIQVGVANPGDQWDLGLVGHYLDGGQRHAGVFRDATDGKFKFFSNTTVEPSNVNYIDTAADSFRLASVVVSTLEGNVIGTVSSIANHTTDALAEGGTNRYYTNARVVQTVTPLLTTGNVVETTNQYFTNVRVLQVVNPLLTTANVAELDNLYYTNARVLSNVEQMSINVLADVDITGIGVNGVLTWDGSKFVPGSTDVALRANFANTAGVANVSLIANFANVSAQVQTLSNFSTNDLVEGANALYYTNSRTRSAFTAGRGIVIQEDGVIKTTIGSDLYSTSIDGVRDFTVTATMDNALVFPSTPTTDRFVLRSLHITNISNNTAYISANVAYATGNIARLASQIPLPVGSVAEFMGDKTQVFAPGDTIRLQGFDEAVSAASGKLSAYMTFETIPNDPTYYGVGETLATSNNDILIADMTQSAGIFESIKFVNHKTTPIPVRLTVTSANNTPKAYWAYNMQVPPQSSLEVLQAPKLLRTNDRLFARYDNASNTDSMSVFTSYRLGSVTNFVSGPGTLVSGNTGTVMFTTSITDGTTLYYTLE